MMDKFTAKDADIVRKALNKAHPDHDWTVTLLPDADGLVVDLAGIRWQITDPSVKGAAIATDAAEWLLARLPKDT